MSWESWLKDKMKKRKYRHKEAAIPDALNALRQFPELKPEVDTFVFQDGSQNELVCFKGTIPVRYKGSVYNIPIKLWLLETHPFMPPLVYVTPTSSMVIKPGKHVDNSGRVYLPYLTDWRSPNSDLHGLIQVLCLVFGDDPPVYSRGSQPPSRPPQPRFGAAQPYYGNVSQQQQQTPYPVSQPGGMPMPSAHQNYGHSSMPLASMPSVSMPASSMPQASLPYSSGSTHPPNYQTSNTSLPPYPTSNANSTSSYQPAPTYPPASQPPYPTTSSNFPTHSSSMMPTSRHEEQTTQAFQPRGGPERQGSVLDANVLKASLLSSVEDKLRRRVKEVFQQAKRELDDLQTTNDELKARSQTLEKIMDNLKQEENMALQNVQLLENKNKEFTEVLNKLENNAANMKIDEAVVTTAPLYNQILNTYAEENAVEDIIYYLGEALRREVIDLETFLKTVRSLSRKQFLLRAQLKKARQTAGLKFLKADFPTEGLKDVLTEASRS